MWNGFERRGRVSDPPFGGCGVQRADAANGRPGLIDAGGSRFQAEQTLQTLDDTGAIGRRSAPIERFENVEAFANRGYRPDTQLASARRNLLFLASPDEDGARGGVDRDVETVFRAIVDEDIEGHRGRDLSARSVHDEDRRRFIALRRQPAIALELRGV